MPDQRAERVAELVKNAIEHGPERWAAFLDQECGSDPLMRADVESLLHEDEGAEQFLEVSALHLAAESLVREGAFHAGQSVGGYQIVSLIGAGGMGDVYLAEDIQLRRKVALKLVRAVMSTDDIVARFRHEEHILASLNDPNIAHLYGGGVTTNGIPFFAMEYVEGLRIDQYCDHHDLSTAARLQLFRKVCSAVHYAHQHLVIHRDLKPSNILVTKEGEPKLLDFGIAKLLKADESAPAVTLVGAMTPDYASPEQVRGESITTASDVYSLGVIFYELLTGRGPYQVKSRTPGEMARAITEQEPQRPSTAVTKGDPPNPHSAIRNPKSLRGDLDNIALMALRKDPVRRYQSVGQFSADIQRHLDGLPVMARKDTFAYRTSKFITRHPFRVAGGFLIVMSLAAGMIATAWQARAAQKEKAKAERVSGFLEQMLSYSNPILNLPRNNGQPSTLTDVLDAAAKRLDGGEFSSEPEIRAELERIIGSNYVSQGKTGLGDGHLQTYIALRYQLYGENDPRTVLATAIQALLLFYHGNLTESENLYRRILPVAREEERKGRLKVEHLVSALNNFGYVRRTQGDSRESEALFREALTLSVKLPDESRYLFLGLARSTLASTLGDQGKLEEALQTSREAVAEYRQRGQTATPDYAFAMTIFGGFLADKGDFAEADTTLHEAEAIFRKLLSSSNLWLGDNLRNQAISLYEQGSYVESSEKVAETLRIYRECFGPHYDHYPTALIIKGLILTRMGQANEGEAVLREAEKIRTDSLPTEHYWVAIARNALGECLTAQQRYSEAEPLLTQSYESLERSQGTNNPRTRLALLRLVDLYEKWRKPDIAAKYRSKR